MMITIEVNGKSYQVDVSPDVPLLWAIREYLRLTGTKYGCGSGMCGACTVHIEGKARRSCQLPIGELRGIGEPGVPPVAPSVAKAVFAAAGIRIRRLPMKPEVVREAIKQG